MSYYLRLLTVLCTFFPLYAYAGGNPDFVKFPEGYNQSFTNYATINRSNQKQVGKFYANKTAISSYKEGQTADPGSIIVMEIYKPKTDAGGKPIVGSNGIFKTDTLAAIAVMEKKDSWDAAYPQDERVGNWGFAIYKSDGTPLSNESNCVQCHTPLKSQDYLFTHQTLIDYVRHQLH